MAAISVIIYVSYYFKSKKNINLKDYSIVFDVLFLIIVILFSGLRFGIGTDFKRLYMLYSGLKSLSFFTIIQFGFEDYEFIKWLIVALNLKIFKCVQTIFFSLSIMFILPLYKTLKKNSYNYQFSLLLVILLGFYLSSFNTVWQMSAVSITFWAIADLLDNNYKSFVLKVIIAAGLHSSVLLILPILIVVKLLKLNRKSTVLIIIVTIIVCYIGINQLSFIFNLNSAYATYTTYKSSNIGLYLQALFWALFCIFFYLYRKELIKLDKKNEYYILLFLVSECMLIIGIQNIMIDRVATYFKIFVIYLIPYLTISTKINEKMIKSYLLIILLVIWFSFYLIFYNGVLPYRICI